jgi:hypothetical protein
MRLKRLAASLMPTREPLPSLFDRHPDALSGSRHPRGVRVVPVDAIVGTARHPSQTTADFLPLPQLRGANWQSRWQRIQAATQELAILPPVELLQVGDEYWVVDGHNRIGAALRNGAAAVDADVTELLLHGAPPAGHLGALQTSLLGSEELRQAGEGRFSPTSEVRRAGPSRNELARMAEALEEAVAEEEAERLQAQEEHDAEDDGEGAASEGAAGEPEGRGT